MQNKTPVSAWFTRVFVVCASLLAVSGLAQMPIFKRYYVADIPGLGWLADFYFTHKMHYVLAALLLALLAQVLVLWFTRWRHVLRMTPGGVVRAGLLAGIVLTGIMRMVKNQPGMSFSPELTMVVDWTHLGLVLLLGMVSLALALLRRRAYAVYRK